VLSTTGISAFDRARTIQVAKIICMALRRHLRRQVHGGESPVAKRSNLVWSSQQRPTRASVSCGCEESLHGSRAAEVGDSNVPNHKDFTVKDQLFLLRPGFFEGSRGPLYCGDSVPVEGLLGFFPDLRRIIDVHYIDAPRPRKSVVDLVGPDNQSIPVLVLSPDRVVKDEAIGIRVDQGRRFINNEADIRKYLSAQYGVPSAG
jgi:hypothetical protein